MARLAARLVFSVVSSLFVVRSSTYICYTQLMDTWGWGVGGVGRKALLLQYSTAGFGMRWCWCWWWLGPRNEFSKGVRSYMYGCYAQISTRNKAGNLVLLVLDWAIFVICLNSLCILLMCSRIQRTTVQYCTVRFQKAKKERNIGEHAVHLFLYVVQQTCIILLFAQKCFFQTFLKIDFLQLCTRVWMTIAEWVRCALK